MPTISVLFQLVTASSDEECVSMHTRPHTISTTQGGPEVKSPSILAFHSDTIHRGAGSSQNLHEEAQKQGVSDGVESAAPGCQQSHSVQPPGSLHWLLGNLEFSTA